MTENDALKRVLQTAAEDWRNVLSCLYLAARAAEMSPVSIALAMGREKATVEAWRTGSGIPMLSDLRHFARALEGQLGVATRKVGDKSIVPSNLSAAGQGRPTDVSEAEARAADGRLLKILEKELALKPFALSFDISVLHIPSEAKMAGREVIYSLYLPATLADDMQRLRRDMRSRNAGASRPRPAAAAPRQPRAGVVPR